MEKTILTMEKSIKTMEKPINTMEKSIKTMEISMNIAHDKFWLEYSANDIEWANALVPPTPHKGGG